MHLFDIMGPIMVGPSSSHTAGAVRIGLIGRGLVNGTPLSATLLLHGSFAATGKGHGTDRALVAGLLGMAPDDANIPRSFALAQEAGMELTLSTTNLRGAHPNTVVLQLKGHDREIEVTAASLGGGRVRVTAIDGMEVTFSGNYPTLITRHEDRPGYVADITTLLSEHGVNIASMQLHRDRRGGLAVLIIESDQPVPTGLPGYLRTLPGVVRCTYLNMGEEI